MTRSIHRAHIVVNHRVRIQRHPVRQPRQAPTEVKRRKPRPRIALRDLLQRRYVRRAEEALQKRMQRDRFIAKYYRVDNRLSRRIDGYFTTMPLAAPDRRAFKPKLNIRSRLEIDLLHM